jgi:hypothetical protein
MRWRQSRLADRGLRFPALPLWLVVVALFDLGTEERERAGVNGRVRGKSGLLRDLWRVFSMPRVVSRYFPCVQPSHFPSASAYPSSALSRCLASSPHMPTFGLLSEPWDANPTKHMGNQTTKIRLIGYEKQLCEQPNNPRCIS